MKQQLLAARRLLERCGWVGFELEPWCRDHRGRPVHHQDEAVQTFSVSGALQAGGGALEPAWELLGRVVSPELAKLEQIERRYTYEQVALIFSWADDLKPLEAFGNLADAGELERARAAHRERGAAVTEWERQVTAAIGEYLTFGGWLIQPARTRADVLRVLSTAALRSTREKCT